MFAFLSCMDRVDVVWLICDTLGRKLDTEMSSYTPIFYIVIQTNIQDHAFASESLKSPNSHL